MSAHDLRTVISLGGSLLVPHGVDAEFAQAVRNLLERRIAQGERFIIVVGGGKVARDYIQAAEKLSHVSSEQLDWVGIYTTRLNAEFMRIVCDELAYDQVIIDPEKIVDTDKPIIFGAGIKPGWSTDYVAVKMAQQVGAKKLLNLSNTNYVYSADPKKDPEAKPLKHITWSEYRQLIPSEWHPGLSTPFDPVASKAAHELGLEVAIINGAKLAEVEKCLAGQDFDGSVIKE
jgi:uridylate kinase